jgi:hypothetical protein
MSCRVRAISRSLRPAAGAGTPAAVVLRAAEAPVRAATDLWLVARRGTARVLARPDR